jgi:hypothetical protein
MARVDGLEVEHYCDGGTLALVARRMLAGR